ncbi:MAG: hypothetical protein ACI9EW_002107 [Cellvibrionaceae bacterium]|jgi:hypothetical protein
MTTSTQDRQKIQLNWYLIGALIIACATAWPLISGGGLINTRGGGDSPFLIQRLHQLEQAIFDGHFPVRWMGDAAYGYGYPFFNFYAPFAFYIAFIYRLIGVSFVQAIQLSQLTAFLVAAWGSFGLAQRWYRRDWVALVVSAAYTTAPFHLVNVYVRGDSIAEFWAMAFYPLVILAADRLLTADSFRGRLGISWLNGMGWLGLAYGGLILSHNISAMIFSPFVILFALCRLAPIFLKSNGIQSLSTSGRFFAILPKLFLLASALILGMAVSAWFWLPALGEQHLTSIADMTVGYFNYRYKNGLHFRSTDLVQNSLLFNPALLDGQAFRMGLVQALIAAVSLIGLALWGAVRKRLGWGIWMFMVLGLLISTFMFNPLSLFLWDTLPLLPFTQFPWRFLSVQAFFTAMLSGVPVFALMRIFGRNPNHSSSDIRKRPVWLAPTLSSLIAVGLVVIAVGKLNLTYLPIADEDVTGYSLAQYEWFTRNIGTTVSAEYLPPEAHPRPVTSSWLDLGDRNRVIVTTGQAEAELISRKTGRQEWQVVVAESEQAIVVFPTLFWKGWNALLDGKIWGGEPAHLSGLIQVTVPPGTHNITLVLGRTRIRAIGELISVSMLVLTLVIFATDTRRWQLGHALLRGVVLPMLALFVVLLAWYFSPAIPEKDRAVYSQDFAQLGWLHPESEIIFENHVSLKSYSAENMVVSAGRPYEIELEWGDVPEGLDVEAEIQLVIPADNFSTRIFPVAQASAPIKNGKTSYQFQIPADAPAGLIVPKLILSDGSRSLTINGEPRGPLFLSPIRIDSVVENSISPKPGLDVSVTDISHPRPNMLRLNLAWQTDRPLAENLVASFRLTDANGNEIHGAQQDYQPGFGHRPTSSWRPNEPIFDVMGMKLPQPLPFDAPYTLLVYLYEADSGGKVRLFRRLGTLEGPTDQLVFRQNPSDFMIPDDAILTDVSLAAEGEPILALHGYKMEPVENGLEVTLYWQALTQPPADYTHFVHLIDLKTGQPVAQHDSMPGNYTWPTSQLALGQIIEDRLFLSTTNLEDGEYLLTAGMYENEGNRFPRLMQINGGNGVVELEKVLIDGN